MKDQMEGTGDRVLRVAFDTPKAFEDFCSEWKPRHGVAFAEWASKKDDGSFEVEGDDDADRVLDIVAGMTGGKAIRIVEDRRQMTPEDWNRLEDSTGGVL
jgi:hypothetical protein